MKQTFLVPRENPGILPMSSCAQSAQNTAFNQADGFHIPVTLVVVHTEPVHMY
jgi:hypothetical protein